MFTLQDKSFLTARTTAAVMSNGLAIFTTTGDVMFKSLVAECYTGNDSTASTLQWSVTANGATATISGTSNSLASLPKGTAISINLAGSTPANALSDTPTISTNAAGVVASPWGDLRVPGGATIKLIIGTGSTTGTWAHYIEYRQLESGAIVLPAF